MRKFAFNRLGIPARRNLFSGIAFALLSLLGYNAQAADAPLGFTVKIYGSYNVPTIEVVNKSQVEITRLTFTIGSTDKHFDVSSDPTPPLGGTITQSPTGGARSATMTLNMTGWGPGETIKFRADVDDGPVGTPADTVEDYRTVFFNNGSDPNSKVTITASDDRQATFTLPDQPTPLANSFTMRFGTPRKLTVTSVTEAAASDYVEKVRVKVNGVYWKTGTNGPVEIGPETKVDEEITVIDGDTIEIIAPREVYRNLAGEDITDSVTIDPNGLKDAQERFTAIGISVNDVPQTADPTLFRFDITKDTVVVVKWQHDFALTVDSDFADTKSPDMAGTNFWAGPLDSKAAGNPDPPVQKHWIKKDEPVIAQVDGQVMDFSHPGLDIRYVPTGYLFDPPDRETRINRTFMVGQSPPQRQQVNEFIMSGPAGIRYSWKIQFGIKVTMDEVSRTALPRIFQITSTETNVLENEGTFWFDPRVRLTVATAANDPASTNKALAGWINGDGYYFSSSGEIRSDDGNLDGGGPAPGVNAVWNPSFIHEGTVYRGLDIPELRRPARVLWTYGNQQLRVVAEVGQYVFQDRPDLAATFTLQPDQITQKNVMWENKSVGDSDMAIWDSVSKKLYPLIAGRFEAKWRPSSESSNQVDVIVNVTPPSRPYPHIANTPPVALDPDPTDNFVFQEIKYSENQASVDGDKRFTAESKGKTVLLFKEIVSGGRGQPKEFLAVRVVDTKLFTEGLITSGNAIIGQKITDPALDRANLETGYLMFSGVRHNSFIYDASKLDGLAVQDVYDMEELLSNSHGKVVVQNSSLPGPIIPVNLHPMAEQPDKITVVWYDDPAQNDQLLWPYQAKVYNQRWPRNPEEGLGTIVIASQYGSESQVTNQLNVVVDQVVVPAIGEAPAETTYNPSRLQQVQIYNQPDKTKPGYNPNEEHALIAPSLRFAQVSPRPPAVYALRENDLNKTFQNENYTSDPYVLSQFLDTADNEFKMRVYRVVKEDRNIPGYRFADKSKLFSSTPPRTLLAEPHLMIEAGEPVIPFYPLVVVIGASPCPQSFGKDLKAQATYWEDHKGTAWAVSGGEDAWFTGSFYYPLAPDFWWPEEEPGFLRDEVVGSAVVQKYTVPQTGDCVSFLPDYINALLSSTPDATATVTGSLLDEISPTRVLYKSDWPESAPVLKSGETLTFSGGEFRGDNPLLPSVGDDGEIEFVETPGLPGIVAFASAEVVFDSLNPLMETAKWKTDWTARVAQVLDVRKVSLPFAEFPPDLQPATQRTRVKGGKLVFNELPASLQNRIRYDSLSGKLEMSGLLNDKDIGDSTLTASPPAVYVLEPNIITAVEEEALANLSPNPNWQRAVSELAKLSRNPDLVDSDNSAIPSPTSSQYRSDLEDFWRDYYAAIGTLPPGGVVPLPVSIAEADSGYLVGLGPKVLRDSSGKVVTVEDPAVPGLQRVVSDPRQGVPVRFFGPGLALLPNAGFLNPKGDLPDISWVTVVENNDPTLGGSPITLHVVKVDRRERYRGAIKTVSSDNVFDENLVLRHTGDFGANADELFFEWWYRPDDGSLNVPPPDLLEPGQTNPWKLFPDPTGDRGKARFQVTLKGNPSAPEALLADTWWFVRYRHMDDNTQGTDWNVDQTDESGTVVDDRVNFTWAGAGNSDPFRDLDGDGLPDFRAQLAQGWIKRVLDAVNPYEARIRDFEGESPSTISSMITEFGARFEGPVALNPSKNVIENVGLIELYETILKRGRDLTIDLSIPVSTPAIANALQLASTRISDFYTLLGNEAYTDALDPTIGFGSDSVEYGSLAPAVFTFQNQVSTLIEEELGLLRGVDYFFARPVYNRMFWNFTKGEGEAAYALNYNISDINQDGFIDEDDAMILYPQGHGDAWGHYLTALRNQYELFKHPFFNWVSRSEFYNLQDIVIKVDFLDERKFAQTAAAKAKAGAEVVDLTYRERYVDDPTAQWQGYTDNNKDRSWGVQGWARRGAQGAYFDWVTANALLPSQHPNTNLVGIQKVDRQENDDIPVISANLNAIQRSFDEANNGQNPLGLAGDVVSFDIDPTLIDRTFATVGTHFEQVYDRAIKALVNTVAIWDNANQTRNMLRKTANSELTFRNSVFQQDLTYRSRLIEIFGRPYEGTIGPGKIYPAGYSGPDTLLFMYVDVRQIDDTTVPGPTLGFAEFNSSGVLSDGDVYNAYYGGDGGIGIPSFLTVDPDIREAFAPTFAPDVLLGLSFSLGGGTALSIPLPGTASIEIRTNLYGVNYTDLSNPKVDLENLTQLMPVTAAGYTFQAPRDWESRLAVGELQLLINQMLQQEAKIASAIGSWDGLQGDIVRTLRLINAKLDKAAASRLQREIFTRIKYITQNVIKGIEGGIQISETLKEVTTLAIDAGSDAIPIGLPIGGLAVGPGDALSAARAGIGITKTVAVPTINVAKGILEISKLVSEITIDIAENELELFEKREDDALAVKEMLKGIEDLVGDEPIKRIEIFREIEALRALSYKYRALVGEGTRLIDERAAFNKRVAAQTQRNRYQDMTFRVSRNHALQTYRSAFDLAARYAYLAAKAYDYETNFDPSDAGSPSGALADIVKARGIGHVSGGQPRLGKGGLAEALARLKANYDVLRGQLGINNPQRETGKISLRSELFRIMPKNSSSTNGSGQFSTAGPESDALWKQVLQDSKVEDLWMVPEFRYYCRPFAPESDGNGEHVAQPGMVIPFSTKIMEGENFFGRPLTGGDHAFDPSHYATRVRSVGVWFSDYQSDDVVNDLPATPRIYMVPVGIDVMSVSSSANPSMVRLWNVVDQQIPVPLPALSSDLENGNWIPVIDSLNGRLGEPRRFARFRAYHNGSDAVDEDELVFDSRLIGRSIWNTQWMIIIPGLTLNANPDLGVERFMEQVSDIKLVFQTYGYAGQ